MGPFGPPVCKTDTEIKFSLHLNTKKKKTDTDTEIADRNLKVACFDYSEKVDQ
jgi:hypothetical protein